MAGYAACFVHARRSQRPYRMQEQILKWLNVHVAAKADRYAPFLVRPGERHGKALVIGHSTLSTRIPCRWKVKARSGTRPVPLMIACMEGAAAT